MHKDLILSIGPDNLSPGSWLQLVPLGSYYVFSAGTVVDFTEQYLQALIDRFESESADVPIDYEHAMFKLAAGLPMRKEDVVAGGWFDKLEMRADGLYGRIKSWVASTLEEVQAGQFRYFSPWISPNAPHRRTGKPGPWLRTVSLTNMPNFDDIQALVASAGVEITEVDHHNSKERTMFERLRKFLKARGVELAADAGEEAIMSALTGWADQIVGSVHADLASLLGHSGEQALSVADAKPLIEKLKAPAVPKEIVAGLGLPETASVADAAAAVLQIKMQQSAAPKTEDIVATVQQQLADQQLLASAIEKGKVAPAMKPIFETYLKSTDPAIVASARKQLELAQPIGPNAPKLGADGKPVDGGGNEVLASVASELGVDPEKAAAKLKQIRGEV